MQTSVPERKVVKMIQSPRQVFFRLSLDPMTMTLNQHHPMTACKLNSKVATCRHCKITYTYLHFVISLYYHLKTYRGSFSGGGCGCCCGGNDDILTLLALAAAVMFLMMQMGGGRRKRSTNEEEVNVSSTTHTCNGILYNLKAMVLIYI